MKYKIGDKPWVVMKYYEQTVLIDIIILQLKIKSIDESLSDEEFIYNVDYIEDTIFNFLTNNNYTCGMFIKDSKYRESLLHEDKYEAFLKARHESEDVVREMQNNIQNTCSSFKEKYI